MSPAVNRLNRMRTAPTLLMLACSSLLLIAAVAANLSANQSAAPVSSQRAAPAAPATPARELVDTYCISCHNERTRAANLILDKADTERPGNSAENWEKVIVKLRSRSMPPPGGARRPDN